MKIYMAFILLIIVLATNGCKKYLEKKPDDKLAVPTTIAEAQALLDLYVMMNGGVPNPGLESDDDFYMSDNYFNTVNNTVQDNYLWKKEIVTDAAWSTMYTKVLYTNTA